MKCQIIGDTHDGKQVVLYESNGERRIRKPRSALTEIAYNTFIERLRDEGFLYIPGTVNILYSDDKEHEVAEVRQFPAESAGDVCLYYRRCGAILFFAYFFSSKDLHDENLIACGALPTIVDYETLFTGTIDRGDIEMGAGTASTVLGSHLLAQWNLLNGRDMDYGGITGEAGQKNILTLCGLTVHSYDYAEDIREGFRYAYDFAMDRKALFGELLHLFDNCRFRIILRPSQLYSAISNRVKAQKYEERYSFAKELLERAYKRDIDPNRIHKAKEAIEYETVAVLHDEIPLFYVYGKGHDLYNRKGVIWKDFLKLSPVRKAEIRLDSLSPMDCRCQMRIIEQALLAVRPIDAGSRETVREKDNEANDDRRNKPSQSENAEDMQSISKSEARSLLGKIEDSHIDILPSGWLALCRAANGRLALQSAGFGLYNGLMGILCAYAAVFYRTADRNILDRLETCYDYYRRKVIPETISLCDFRSGLQEGIGGHLLALHHLYDLTGNNDFLSDAQRIVNAICIEKSRTEGEYDVLSGYAGLAVALPYFTSHAAERIAEYLSSILVNAEVTQTGTAHGAAGVALALGAVGHVMNTDRFDTRIRELLEWENTYYDENEYNWQDLRTREKTAFMYGWCSGAPGIGMARKRLMEYSKNEEIRSICLADIARVRISLERNRRLSTDGLCCGNSAVLMAASSLGVPADERLWELVNKVREDRIHLVHLANTCDVCTGLMQGVSGICYALAMYSDEKSGGMLF